MNIDFVSDFLPSGDFAGATKKRSTAPAAFASPTRPLGNNPRRIDESNHLDIDFAPSPANAQPMTWFPLQPTCR
ncbi:hypothetical protein ACFWAY_18235 [Rhodococcus sp. NPDC059968]|uniref:hypothetical protein n=1 Tax=Rhodococcus sp. NPDC059968 TaxID=3347017 RepID=UPI0036710FFA